ncbi:MAG: iron ABC transporter permease [Firmicutes bacterium]|nr:iron ABC transporter permease [Bacillota bacterium]
MRIRNLILLLLCIGSIFISLFIGSYKVSPGEVLDLLWTRLTSGDLSRFPLLLQTAILDIRLPRITVVFLVGMTLSIAGVVYQAAFQNPLVSDHVLGVSNGAAFGAALALLLGLEMIAVQTLAFIFGIVAVLISWGISRTYAKASNLTLVLSGIITGGFFSALVSFMKSIADPLDKMPAIVFWLMGSFARVSKSDLWYSVLFMGLPLLMLFLVRWRINVLAMGEEDAKALGMNTTQFRFVLIILCTIATACAVSVSGVVAWVGLVIPHIARIIVGPDHKDLVPAAMAIGGSYLLLMDDLAKSITTSEISIGILTSLIGAPFFAYLLRKGTGWK